MSAKSAQKLACALALCAGAWLSFGRTARADPPGAPASPAALVAAPAREPAELTPCPVCPALADNPFDEPGRGPQAVDLNSADERALLDLPGIGPARARAIVAFRGAHGAFRSISELLQIRGIGRALLKQLRPLVTLTEHRR